jgi:serine protease
MRGAAGSERAIAARLGADARVVYAEPDYLRQPHRALPQLWAFHNPGNLTIKFTRGGNRGQVVSNYLSTNDADVDNEDGFASGGDDVVIGGIDTGVDFSHFEFSGGRLIAGFDWYSNDTDPSDTDSHGTHTAGTMAGHTVGVAGVADAAAHVKVYVQRVCGGAGCPTSAIVNAIRAAADIQGMVAMNLSLGGGSESQAEKDAIAYAVNTRNVLVIASAGNGGTNTVSCPACDPLAISVGALNWQDGLSYYTNTGSGLDLTAPGGEMYSNTTDESGIYSSVPGGYAYYQGTSMAAPVVTGIAAIVASQTGLRGSALRARLEGTTDELGATGYDTSFGHGRVNAYRAVTTMNPGGGGQDPVDAAFSTRCSNATCTFDGSGSTGTSLTYSWTFDGGDTENGVIATRTYSTAGSYPVTLTVISGTATDTATGTVTCQVRGKNLKCS